MRLMSWPLLGLSVLLLLAGSGLTALAQQPYPQRGPYGYASPPPQPDPRRDPRAYPPGYYPGKLVQPAPQAPAFSLRRLLGIPDDQPPPPVVAPRRISPPPAVARQERPKPNASAHVVVFGDALAEFARQGLADALAEDETTEVVSKVRSDSTLVRGDAAEASNAIRAALDGGQKISLAVVMLGLNDRQPFREADNGGDVLSVSWRELYRQRVDSVLRVFQERNIPVVWIGLPPMRNSRASEDLVAMNEIYRESVQRAGGAYVDIWPGFVDDENRYTATGPDVDGAPARLRTGDGVSFTRAGARKIAHFADVEIKRFLGGPAPASATVSVPDPSAAPLPEAPVPARPAIGPVLPLTRPDLAPGGTLVSERPKFSGDSASSAQRALRDGIAPPPRPGRADDFRWPRE